MSEPIEDGGRVRISAIKWIVLSVVMIGAAWVVTTFAFVNATNEEKLAREQRREFIVRMDSAQWDRKSEHDKMLAELRLQTFVRALPEGDQRLMLPTLIRRLDEEARKEILSLKLRSLNVIGPQESQTLQPQRRSWNQAP